MYFLKTLDNGIRFVCQQIPHFRSVSIGLWAEAGPVFERPEENGISHYIEHMMFKGTKTRTALDISSSIDRIGGQINAFTGKECTCFYIKVRDSHFRLSAELLSDMLINSLFDEDEQKKEKDVIVEEIHMAYDEPEDLAHELLATSYFSGSTLSYPILGTEDTVRSFDGEAIRRYMSRTYSPERLVISVAGNVNPEEAYGILNELFGTYSVNKCDAEIPVPPIDTDFIKFSGKAIEQAHLCVAFDGVSSNADESYALSLISNVLGGSMSSRMFTEIREKRGLAYSVYSFPSLYKQAGMLIVYAAMRPENLKTTYDLILEEMNRFVSEGFAEGEFDEACEQLKGSFILGGESTSARMSSLGKGLLLRGDIREDDEILARIDMIGRDNAEALAKRLFAAPKKVSIVGPEERISFPV